MALLFECMGKCCRNMLDTADIVRDACFRQLLFVRAGHKKGESVTRAFLSRSHPWERNQAIVADNRPTPRIRGVRVTSWIWFNRTVTSLSWSGDQDSPIFRASSPA